MISNTLDRKEYKEFLLVTHLKKRDFSEDFKYLESMVNDSKGWHRQLVGLNHLFSIVLEQFEKVGEENQAIIEYVYELDNDMSFNIEEGSIDLITSLFSIENDGSESLEELLIKAEDGIYDDR